ncbi:hypothetical protein PGB90_009342 [Kerria lacca]
MNKNTYDEQLSNQGFVLLEEDLWKVLDDALCSNIMVQNMLESWYTVAGLKFIFHVYNNVNNDFWKFKNLDDRNLIIWNCIEIIHEILNHGLKDLYDKKNVDTIVDFKDFDNKYVMPTTYFITKSCVLSILNSVNEATILSTAITGDVILLETIIESACWTKGKSAIFINIITYSLSLIQRCLIFVDVEKSSLLVLMAICIMKQIVIADALLEIDKVRKICLEKCVPDSKWQNLLLFTSRYIRDIFCSDVIDEPTHLSVEFEIINIPVSAVADSWKKFLQVVTSQCSDLIEIPGKTAFPVFDKLIEELSSSEFNKKEKFLCDIYRIYLATWEKNCSESNWRSELLLTNKMFIVLNEIYQNYTGPYFFSALLEIGYKIHKFGVEHIHVINDLTEKQSSDSKTLLMDFHSRNKSYLFTVLRMKEFIRNSINDNITDELTIPPAIDDYETFKLVTAEEFLYADKTQNLELSENNDVSAVQTISMLSVIPESENDIKLYTATFGIVARLFFKLITTFKHS